MQPRFVVQLLKAHTHRRPSSYALIRVHLHFRQDRNKAWAARTARETVFPCQNIFAEAFELPALFFLLSFGPFAPSFGEHVYGCVYFFVGNVAHLAHHPLDKTARHCSLT